MLQSDVADEKIAAFFNGRWSVCLVQHAAALTFIPVHRLLSALVVLPVALQRLPLLVGHAAWPTVEPTVTATAGDGCAEGLDPSHCLVNWIGWFVAAVLTPVTADAAPPEELLRELVLSSCSG